MASRDEQLGVPLACPVPAEAGVARLQLPLANGYQTDMLRWAGDTRKPPVLMMHGIQSHPGWFIGSAAAMWRAGHCVYQFTRRGSGANTARRGHAASARQLLDDVAVAHRYVLKETDAASCHLVGVSWGGKLLAAYASEHGDTAAIASLMLLSPGIVPQVDVSWRTKLAIALCLLVAPRRLFDIPLRGVELFTDNEAARQYLRDDELRLQRATARFLYANRCLDRMLKRAPAGAIHAPTTLILAEGDRIIDNAATAAEVARLTAGRAVVQQLPGCHTLDFQPDPVSFHQALCEALARAE